MRRAALASLVVVMTAASVGAQTRDRPFYLGGVTAAEAGDRGNISGRTDTLAGGMVGLRFTHSLSVEVELARVFHTTHQVSEAVWIAYPTSQNPTYEEIQRLGIRARFDRTQKGGPAFSALLVWRTREPGRLNVAVFGGVTAQHFESRTLRTHVSAPAELNLPPTHPNLQTSNELRGMTGGGPTAGLMVLVAVTPWLTVAPELRCTSGIITDDPFRVVRGGVRVLWGF